MQNAACFFITARGNIHRLNNQNKWAKHCPAFERFSRIPPLLLPGNRFVRGPIPDDVAHHEIGIRGQDYVALFDCLIVLVREIINISSA
jgi:hypothetical protein